MNCLYHLLKRNILMVVSLQCDVAYTLQQLAPCRVATKAGSQRQSIDKEANKRFQCRMRTISNRSANSDILLPTIISEQYLEASYESHKRRHTLLLTEYKNLLGDGLRPLRSTMGSRRRVREYAGTVGGKLQYRRASEL